MSKTTMPQRKHNIVIDLETSGISTPTMPAKESRLKVKLYAMKKGTMVFIYS